MFQALSPDCFFVYSRSFCVFVLFLNLVVRTPQISHRGARYIQQYVRADPRVRQREKGQNTKYIRRNYGDKIQGTQRRYTSACGGRVVFQEFGGGALGECRLRGEASCISYQVHACGVWVVPSGMELLAFVSR